MMKIASKKRKDNQSMPDLGKNFETIRRNVGFTRPQMAKYMGLDTKTLEKFETENEPIGVTPLEKACILLGISLADLEKNNAASIYWKFDNLRPCEYPDDLIEALATVNKIVLNTQQMNKKLKE